MKITYDQKNINFEKDFEIRSLKELVKEELNVESLENEEDIFDLAKKKKIKIEKNWGWG